MEKSWHDKLDEVLTILSKKEGFVTIESFSKEQNTNEMEIRSTFHYLLERGFLMTEWFDNRHLEYKYAISIKGRLFLENDGYKQENKDIILNREMQQADLKRRNQNDLLLVRGTIGATVVASFLLLLEVIKFLETHPYFFCCHP